MKTELSGFIIQWDSCIAIECHRENGPAVENGDNAYYLNGEQLSFNK